MTGDIFRQEYELMKKRLLDLKLELWGTEKEIEDLSKDIEKYEKALKFV